MSDPTDWTDKQREAIERWADKPPEDRHPNDLLPEGRKSSDEGGGGSNVVSPDECAEMRRVFKQDGDLTIKAMAEQRFSYSRTTIAEHVFARRCTHEIAEPAAESPMDSIDPDEFIQPDECAEMREMYHDGAEIPEVQAAWDASYGQAYHHLAGRCTCEHDVYDIRDNPVDK